MRTRVVIFWITAALLTWFVVMPLLSFLFSALVGGILFFVALVMVVLALSIAWPWLRKKLNL